jgi:hypothetical protein
MDTASSGGEGREGKGSCKQARTYPEPASAQLREDDPSDRGGDQQDHHGNGDASTGGHHVPLPSRLSWVILSGGDVSLTPKVSSHEESKADRSCGYPGGGR